MSLDNVVKITISRNAPAVSRAGFGTALILGAAMTGWGSTRVKTYTAPADMLEDGFTSGDLEYKEAVSLYSQPVKPARFKVGRRLTAQAQVNTLTPDVTNQSIQDFIVTIEGVEYKFTSDASPTAGEVVTGLITLINAGAQPVTASGTTTLVLTSDNVGVGFGVTVSANLTNVATTPNIGAASDISDIVGIDKDWYALILADRSVNAILEAAKTIESMKRIFIPCNSDSAVITAGSSDIASLLKARGYNRSAYIFSAQQANGPEAALLGNILPRVIGTYTAKFKTLVGIPVDELSATQYTLAKGKNANIHTEIAGAGMFEEGVVASGEFLDVIIGCDWIDVNMQADVFQVFRDNPKVPYSNAGIATLESAVSNRLRLATVNGILTEDRPYSVTTPPVADQDPANKTARKIGGMKFVGYLAGAIHAVEIDGNVLLP